MKYSEQLIAAKYFKEKIGHRAKNDDDLMLRAVEDAFYAGKNSKELNDRLALNDWLTRILKNKRSLEGVNYKRRKLKKEARQKMIFIENEE